MDTLSSHSVEETNCMRSGKGGEEEVEEEEKGGDEEDKEKGKYDSQTEESAVQRQQKPPWAPCFYYKIDKEVYYYVGHKIIIEEALDSYGGMIWPAALALCNYLDTNREQLNLMDKAVLEIRAGTGLVSVVAALLGAWVTASDLPEVMSNLRVNLSRNTTGRCRHTPQVAALSWGYDLESTYPTSVYRYDYILAADVVYHHDFLDELLATMKHFCRPGTTVIWANKVRMENDLTFIGNFKKAFHTSLLAEDGDMKIFMATCREEEGEGDEIQDLLREKPEDEDENNKAKPVEEKHNEDELHCVNKQKNEGKENNDDVTEEPHMLEAERGDDEEEKHDHECEEEEEMEVTMVLKDDEYKEDERNKPENNDSHCNTTASDVETTGHMSLMQKAVQQDRVPAWVSSIQSTFGKDVYHYVGQDIVIYESIDSYGAVMWPAALALCSFLDNNRDEVNLQGKEVLELGAGTGLVTIVASLLGASVTSTDLPEVLSNLRANVMRNTRKHCRHTPEVEVLSWGYDLERTHPTSVYRYDYILAADVVYHHDFLDELLATMKHFCRPGTTVIWANKVRMENDLTFTENFKKAFHTSLLAEDGDMKIFMGTCRHRDRKSIH